MAMTSLRQEEEEEEEEEERGGGNAVGDPNVARVINHPSPLYPRSDPRPHTQPLPWEKGPEETNGTFGIPPHETDGASPHGDPQPKSPSTRQPRQQHAPPQKPHGKTRQTKQSRRTHPQRKRLKHQQQSIESDTMTEEVPVCSAAGSILAEQEGTPKLKRERKPQRPGKYVCSYCGRACAKPSVLQKHIRSHTGERPYPCAPCGFSFKTKSNLYKHRKSHTHRVKAGLAFSEPRSLEEQATESEDEAKQMPSSASGMEHQSSTTSAKSHESDGIKDLSRGMDDSYAVKKRLAMRLSRGKRSPLDSSDERVSSSLLGSRGSTESGYFSRSESTEQSQDSPPNTSAKSYAEIILGKYGRLGHLQRMSRHQNQQISGEEEKNIPFTVPKKQVIDHITKLITINEAVVDTTFHKPPQQQHPTESTPQNLVHQHNMRVPEILVTDSNMDTQSSSKATPTSKQPEKLEEFQWPQRSPTLAQLPIEKLPPKKKRLRLAEIAQSSGESSFDSISLPHSPSQDSSTSHASSRSASFEESGRVDLEVTSATPLRRSRASHLLTVPRVHQHREMRRSVSEQAPHDPQQGVLMSENRSKSFDYSCLSPERSAVGWRERRKCLLLKHSAVRDPEEEEEGGAAVVVRLQADTLLPACAIYTTQSQTTPARSSLQPMGIATRSASISLSTHQGCSSAGSEYLDWSEDPLRLSGTGGNKRMLSPSNSVEFSLESQQQQKRVKEEEEERGVEDEASAEAGSEREEDNSRRRPSVCLPVEQMGVSLQSLESGTCNSWCYLNYMKPNPFALDERRPSVYSSWSTGSYNPNPLGLSSGTALSLLQCKQSLGPTVYTTSPMGNGSVETIRAEDHQRPASTEVSSSLSCDKEYASTRDEALSAEDRSSNKGDKEEEEEGPNQANVKEEHQSSAKYRHPSQPWTCSEGSSGQPRLAYARGEQGICEGPPLFDQHDEKPEESQHHPLQESTGMFHSNNTNEEDDDGDNNADLKGCQGVPSASPTSQSAGEPVGRASGSLTQTPSAGSRRALFARLRLPPPPPRTPPPMTPPPRTTPSPDRLPLTRARSPPGLHHPRSPPISTTVSPATSPTTSPATSPGLQISRSPANRTLPCLHPDTLPPPSPPRTSRALLSHLPLHSQLPAGGASPSLTIAIGGIHMIQPHRPPPYHPACANPRRTL
ncbi:unnamed protein product [Merluccius merluccius]